MKQMQDQQNIIEIKNLVKTYPNGVTALKGIDLKVKKGEFLVIIGLSGSGKSTLLRCLNRLHDPTSGEIYFKGQEVSKIQGAEIRKLRQRIGMIFQHFNLIPRQTVLENVLMGALGKMGSWKSIFGLFTEADHQKANDALKRVAIARALTQNPDVLLADEPVASLDPATCHVVMDHLKKVNEELGITVIANLHFLSLVRQYATRVVALKAGEIVYEGSPTDITDDWFQRIYGEGAKEVHIN